MCKYSIVIPIYNTEKYIEECLNSIKYQKIESFEVLMIDDGSSDSSSDICKVFCDSDKRFKYYYKENGGVSSARNYGINKAKGKYILFVDSDDFVVNDYLSVIDKNLIEDKLLCFDFFDMYLGENKRHNSNKIEDEDLKDKILISNELGGFLFNKVFNLSIIIQNNIRFNESIHFCEDLLFVSTYLDFESQINYCNKPLYYYRIRKSSVSNSFISQKNVSILAVYKLLIKKYDDIKYKNYYSYMYYYYYYLLRKFYKIEPVNSKIILKQNSVKLFILKIFPKQFLKLKKLKSPKNVYE